MFILLAIITYVGFGVEKARITGCEATTKKYVTAEFSEYSCELESGIDSDGNSYTETVCDTDYWSEPASDVWVVTTFDNTLRSSSVQNPILTSLKYYTSDMPPRDNGWSTSADFDNFKEHVVSSATVYLDRKGEADHFTTKVSYNLQCNENKRLEKFITVKVWYGISYGSED